VKPLHALLLSSLIAVSAAAQTADLTLKLDADARYNAGEVGTLRTTVTNAGPDAATSPGVRLAKPSALFVGASQFGCIEFPDSILCNGPILAAGQSREFVVPFAAPDDAGTLQLNARTESFTLDPNHDNDAATATVDVVRVADVSIEPSVYPSLRVGHESQVFVTIRQHAAVRPDPVTFLATFPEPITVDVPSICLHVDATTIRCTVKTFGSDISTYFDVVPTATASAVTMTFSIESPADDWNPANNRASLTLPIYDAPDLSVRIDAPSVVDAANRAVATFTFTNPTDVPAVNVQAEIITNPGTPDPTVSGGWTCRPSSTYRLQCENPRIAPHASSTLNVIVQFDRQYFRGTLGTNVTTKPASDAIIPVQSFFADAVFYKTYTVTALVDSGAGSLRQAILNANAECTTTDGNPPCEIIFGVSGTIVPQSALPRVTVTDFKIDGDKRITLDGSNAGDANGLDLFNAGAVVNGLAIHNFSRNAIFSTTNINAFLTRHHVIQNSDLSGNGLRGVMASYYQGEITANVIRDNKRSAIFLTNSGATIRDNALDRNGASGIYIGGLSAVLIEGNTITTEHEFGIAIDYNATAQVFGNAITSVGGPGIDIGLDGPTLDHTPVIVSAQFDGVNTVIEGTIPPVSIPYRVTATAYVYANTADKPAGETFLGSVQADHSGHFTLRYGGDLSGKYIDASANNVTDFGDFISRASTEFGNRTRVER
jgi:parallel beta helix pectate lyase-like protein/uncharacterized protein DUF11